MSHISFLKQYIKDPRRIGALIPSSKHLAHKMIEGIDFEKAETIVEYGPGTGVFTDRLIKNRKQDTTILIVEFNLKFYNLLKEKYKGLQNIHIICGSAEHIDEHLKQYGIGNVDYVISGLPFASLRKEITNNILTSTSRILKEKGEFITFQYTLLKKDFINRYFDNLHVKMELRNIPPAYVFSCSNIECRAFEVVDETSTIS